MNNPRCWRWQSWRKRLQTWGHGPLGARWTAAAASPLFVPIYKGARKEGLTQYGSSYIHVWPLSKAKSILWYPAPCKARRHTSGEVREIIHWNSDSEGGGSSQNDLIIGCSHAAFMHHSSLQNDGGGRGRILPKPHATTKEAKASHRNRSNQNCHFHWKNR